MTHKEREVEYSGEDGCSRKLSNGVIQRTVMPRNSEWPVRGKCQTNQRLIRHERTNFGFKKT